MFLMLIFCSLWPWDANSVHLKNRATSSVENDFVHIELRSLLWSNTRGSARAETRERNAGDVG